MRRDVLNTRLPPLWHWHMTHYISLLANSRSLHPTVPRHAGGKVHLRRRSDCSRGVHCTDERHQRREQKQHDVIQAACADPFVLARCGCGRSGAKDIGAKVSFQVPHYNKPWRWCEYEQQNSCFIFKCSGLLLFSQFLCNETHEIFFHRRASGITYWSILRLLEKPLISAGFEPMISEAWPYPLPPLTSH